MPDTYTELRIRIYRYREDLDAYPVEATILPGHAGFEGELKLDRTELRAAIPDPASYGLQLTEALFAGDVILLEAQHFPPGNAAPLPIEQAEHDVLKAIQTAVLNHRLVVVEAAGNGAQDIGAGEEDSGAIIVGAATSGAPHFCLGASNYGERVDCYAWGEAINTLWSDNSGNTNTKSFGKTSGAVAIIAGAAVLVQSAAKVKRGAPLEPSELRDMFREIGTASGDADEFPIGVMPDLEKIVAAL